MTFPGIESVCGGEPCVARTRLPVWLLEQARRLGTSEVGLLQGSPTLRAHLEEIDRQIRENETDTV